MKTTSNNGRVWADRARGVALCAAIFLGCAGGVTPVAMAQTKAPEIKRSESGTDQDVLVLKDGTVLTGTIISEDKAKVRFKRLIAGIPFEEDIELKKIAEIKKASKKPSDAPETKPAATDAGKPEAKPETKSDSKASKPEVMGNGDGTAYYWIKLEGVVGRDISQTPVRQAVDDARQHKADIIVVEVNSRWTGQVPPEYADYVQPGAGIDKVFRVEPISTIFTNDIPKDWGDQQPRVIMWVKEGRGGIAPLAFAAKEIYFHSNGQLGGLGGLESIFEGRGDDVVREKQRSLRLGHLEGIVRAGGHDDRIMRAMTRSEFILTLAYDSDGKAVLVERRPENPGEELLTDSGQGAEADTAGEAMSGLGNDWLTLDARRANLVGLSLATVDTPDELLLALGLDRSGRKIEAKSTRIMQDWVTSIDRAERALKRAARELADVQVEAPGGWNERRAARGKQKKYLQEMKQIQTKWGEGLTPQFLNQNQIPGLPQIEDALNALETQQQLDKKDK